MLLYRLYSHCMSSYIRMCVVEVLFFHLSFSVHLKVMEKMTVSCGPECVMDVNGVMQLTVTDQDHAHINIEIDKGT